VRDGGVAHANPRDGAVEMLEEDGVERRRGRREPLDHEIDELVVQTLYEA
jgi:hypothetical protein